jgi:hypothetical protein
MGCGSAGREWSLRTASIIDTSKLRRREGIVAVDRDFGMRAGVAGTNEVFTKLHARTQLIADATSELRTIRQELRKNRGIAG